MIGPAPARELLEPARGGGAPVDAVRAGPPPADAPGVQFPPAAGAAAAAAPSDVLERSIQAARDALIGLQSPQGFWLFELEADCTIAAEYIMMMHFLDEIDPVLEVKLVRYLRARQGADGGWPLYHGARLDLSCSVKVYYALKLAGDGPDAAHMVRAREAILARGGAARVNVFTRIALALFAQVPWRAVPYIPVEIMLLPRWFPFHLDKVSYWSRTVMVPLFVLCTLKPRARNPRGVDVRELFTVPPEAVRHWFARGGIVNHLFLAFDHLARALDPLIPGALRRRAIRRAHDWVVPRLNGEDGLGAIFPAMVNALEMLVLLGAPPDDPHRATAKRALEKLLVVGTEEAYCQPCVSPVWDSALAARAMQEIGGPQAEGAARRALEWLLPLQQLDGEADWQSRRPHVRPGGWPFQFRNDHYPDLDDTAVVAWAMHRAGDPQRFGTAIDRALEWMAGLQCRNGGFAAFDADNTCYYLNEIPFADHGALLDPPTEDVTGRVVTALSTVGRPQDRPVIERALAYLRAAQQPEGCWWGRWGTNYVYGTWSVLVGLEAAGVPPTDPMVRRAVQWLRQQQNADGGWGESNDSYDDGQRRFGAPDQTAHAGEPSAPFSTAWALLGLLAAGEVDSDAVRAGVRYLIARQRRSGLWSDARFTAPGFPRVFYLKYHGYCAYFPLWALAEYRRRGAGRPA
ncbi:MAG TPA: squalene--hopene cyclase [Steroidobacteraceae bacterium]|nr:squalene--hopene cyclase [Steroidobacteraceae bacterium]